MPKNLKEKVKVTILNGNRRLRLLTSLFKHAYTTNPIRNKQNHLIIGIPSIKSNHMTKYFKEMRKVTIPIGTPRRG